MGAEGVRVEVTENEARRVINALRMIGAHFEAKALEYERLGNQDMYTQDCRNRAESYFGLANILQARLEGIKRL